MSDQLGSSRLEALFESALLDYEKQTGISLAKHPLAEQFQNCQSIESVTTLLQEQARSFSEFRESNKIRKSLKSIASAISSVFARAAFGHDIGMSFQLAVAIHTGLGILLAEFKGVGFNFDALVGLLETIARVLKQLDIYTKVPPTPAMTEMVVKIMVELLCTLTFLTKQIKQGQHGEFVKKTKRGNDAEAVLQRLDRLTQEEARTTAPQALDVVYGLIQNMRIVIDDDKESALDAVRDALETMQKIASEMNKSKRDKLRQDVHRWLSPPDPWKNHNLACKSRHTGTAEWFVEGDTLSEWKSSGSSSLLWVHGKPGAGKSVLCSAIIENIDSMRKSGLAYLAFFYCDYREDQKRDLRGLLSSVLAQLCHQSDSYCQILSTFYSEHENGARQPGDDGLMQCLKDILRLPGQAPVYLIVDGLDECSNTSATPSPREKILMLFENLVKSQLPDLRICVTSRPETDIKFALEFFTFRSISLHDESEQRKDIENYITSVINTDPRMRRWKAIDKELAVDVLIKKSDGMFRWVYCQIDYLRHCLPARIRHALCELPVTLEETYNRVLGEIHKENREIAYRLLQCVAVASRPLEVTELAEILSLDFQTGPIPKFHADWRLEDPIEAVLSTTSSLLVVVKPHAWIPPVIQFSHFSVKEYLTSSRLAETYNINCRRYHISMTSAHTVIARASLGILLHLDENMVSGDVLENFPLAKYAAEHWVDHAQVEGVSGNIEDGMKLLFDPGKLHLAIWVWIFDPMLPWQHTRQAGRPLEPKTPPLHYAADCGLHAIVKFLIIQHSQDVHSRAFDNKLTPLHLASRRGHMDVVHLLLEHGADSTAQDEGGWTPLHLASVNGHEKVARSLLESGADATAQTKGGETPLHWASQDGRADIARLLLEHGADATAQTKHLETPLHMALQNGHKDIGRLLLEHGADATAQTKDGETLLHWASQYGLEDIAHILLEHGASSTAQNERGWTPLHLASQYGLEDIARLLLEHGADVTVPTKHMETPLHLASQNGHKDTTRLLLEHGADVTTQNADESTPLHVAAGRGQVDVVRVLLEHGADANTQDVEGWSALHHASRGGHIEVTWVLLQYIADVTVRNQDESTPLHFASGCGRVDIALALLESGADPNAQDVEGWTPLHQASGGGYVEVTRLLLERGANASQDLDKPSSPDLGSGHGDVPMALLEYDVEVDAKDKSWTPLHLASQEGHVEVVRLLLDSGENPNAKKGNQETPLSLASSYGRRKVVQFLLEKGADSNSHDWQRRTPLHEASENGHLDVVFLLLDRGVNVNAKEAHLWAPLHMASKTGNLAVTLELLDRGAEVEAQDDLCWTPLHIASQEGHQEVVRLLLNRRAHVDTLEADRETALHLAAYYGHLQVTRLLLDRGADVHALNKNGKIPSELASEEGYHEVAELLLEVEATQPVEPRTDRQSVLKAQDHTTSIDYPPPPGASHGPESVP